MVKRSGKRPEILAPAGDMDALRAALLAGADAVYLGGRRFGARAFAGNFDRDALRRARRATQRLGRRLHVTLNTIVFDREWPSFEAELDFLEELGPDAVIVQDLGVLATLARRGSVLERHLSTQAAWDGSGGGDVLRELGVARVVLPRETPLDDVATIVRDSPFEVETFVHGAHCYSVSGRCWWSVALGPRSGNRGTCAQPCRRSYRRAAGPSEPLFSTKDLRLVHRLRELADAGVASFKIEGRMKGAAYVAAVVRAYRAALDTGGADDRADEALDAVFARESCEGFVDGSPARWRTSGVVGARGVSVGVVAGRPDERGRVAVDLTTSVCAGDGLAWGEGDRRGGDRVTWVSEPGAGRRTVRLRRGPAPPRGVTLYRTDAARAASPLDGWISAWERPSVTLRFAGAEGAPLTCAFDDGEGRRGSVASTVPLAASAADRLAGVLAERFGALEGDRWAATPDLSTLPGGLFLPPSELRALRRALVARLDESVAAPSDSARPDELPAGDGPQEDEGLGGAAAPGTTSGPRPALRIRLWQADAAADLAHLRPGGGWILPAEGEPAAAGGLVGPIGWWLPPLSGPASLARLQALVRKLPPGDVLCSSWEAFALAPREPERRFVLDWTFNVVNERALSLVRARGLDAVAGPEAPASFLATARVVRANPLVSLSRFAARPVSSTAELAGEKGDRYRLVPVADGAWGLFLLRPPGDLPAGASAVQIDVFLPDGPGRAVTIAALERILRAP